MDSEETDVAARSRALFEQLRAIRGHGADPGAAGEVTDVPVEAGEQADGAGEVSASGVAELEVGAVAEETPAAGSSGAAAVAGDAASIGVAGDAASTGPTEVAGDPTSLHPGAAPAADAADTSGHPAPDPATVEPPEVVPPADAAGADVVSANLTEITADIRDAVPPPVEPVNPAPAAQADAGESAGHPAADLPLPRVLAIANQKGGVGKTTTTVNLGAALAELGYRVLVVDLDPQGNATTGLGVNARNLEHSVYDVLMHELPLDECIEPTSVRNLFVAPATIDLAGAEIELVPAFSRELRLRRALADTADAYDFTLIDCPPSLGLLTVNGLAAASEVVVPIQCEYYALEGLSQLLRNINLVQSNLNPPLVMSAIILTMYDARTKLADQVAGEVRTHFGARVCRHVVPRTVRLSEAPSFGQPIIVFDPSSRGALAYRELAKEVSGGAPQRVG